MEENKNEVNGINEEELLKKVEKAAAKGVRKGGIRNVLISILPTLIVVLILGLLIVPKINSLHQGLNSLFHFDEPLADHDLTIDNHGFLGYTAADFEEAILGDSQQLKKLEVFTQEVSDVATITDTGLFNWSAFTKVQLITYNGTATYTVDLGTLSKNDIKVDEENKVITLTIPHAVQEDIHIPEDQIQFGDTTKGLLSFGDIKMTVEESTQVQIEAKAKMEQKLKDSDAQANADRFAKLSVWEIYSPIIKGVASDYSLEVEFR